MNVVITGLGFHGALAEDVSGFARALRSGRARVAATTLRRSGRTIATSLYEPARTPPAGEDHRLLRGRPAAMLASCFAAREALALARWDESDCGVIAGGSNLHQAFIADTYERFLEEPQYVNPRYAASFLDTTLVSIVSEIHKLRGPGFTTGGGMASGNVALFQGWMLIRSGAARACLCVGAMSEFSEMELVAFANAGALATVERDADAGNASRPFDESTTGFTYAQAAAAVLLESADSAASRGATPLAELAGASVVLDGSSGTEADAGGEARALRAALATASIDPAEVAYVNTHGSGTPAGDRAECEAIRATLGTHPRLNSTKAITGHTMSAAGIVELVATVIQMRDGFLHPNPRLETPIDHDLGFTGRTAEPFSFDIALSNSFSIGGFNTCVAVRRWDAPPRGRA